MHEATFLSSRLADFLTPWLTRAMNALLLLGTGSLIAASTIPRTGNGRIAVGTLPGGATIYLDGQAAGKTPGEIEGLGPGRYFLRLELDGYRPAEIVVELSSGQNYQSPAIELVPVGAPVRQVEPPPPMPAATPAPVVRATPPPMPAATPVPVPPPAATPPPPVAPAAAAPTSATADDETISRLVSAHLKAIADGDIETYLRLCAPKVELYDEGLQGHEFIRKSRQKLKDRWPVYEISNVRDFAVRATDRPDVRRAAVTYDWNVSNPKTGKKASGTASDLLDFRQTAGQWLIVKARQNVDRKSK
jgi:ketosteroid isomerase-like protein